MTKMWKFGYFSVKGITNHGAPHNSANANTRCLGFMHRFVDDHTSNNLLILTKYYSKNFATRLLLIIEHMAMFIDTYTCIF